MFIKDFEKDSSTLARIKRDRSHWNAVAKVLYATDTVEQVLEMLYDEIHTNRRPYVIRRIYAHFNALRRKQELVDLTEYIKQVSY